MQNNNFTSSLMGVSVPGSTALANRATTRAGELMLQNAIVEATHEHYRAWLTKAALENTAALSAYEAQLYRVSPFGEERYKVINDAYAYSAAMRIARW